MRIFPFLVLLMVLLGWSTQVLGQRLSYSSEATISLLTSSPGDELYSTFGHNTIRIKDPVTGLDMVYDYGTFDFDTPGFYEKFVRGKLPYKLARRRTRNFLAAYKGDNRQVVEAPFQLDSSGTMRVIDFLETNYLPENQYYAYDFYYDNCATRVRDLFEEEFGIVYTDSTDNDLTLRQHLDAYMEKMRWTNFGMDLLIGIPSDADADFRMEMFLPDYLYKHLRHARYQRAGEWVDLLGPEKIILQRQEEQLKVSPFGPFLVFLLVSLVLIALRFLASAKLNNGIDLFLFFVLGLMGLFLLFMWVGTDHITTKQNLNLVWANPLHWVSFFLLWFGRKNSIFKPWFIFFGGLYVLLLVSGWAWPQQFHAALYSFWLALAVRCLWQGGLFQRRSE